MIIYAIILAASMVLDCWAYLAIIRKHGPQYNYWPYSGIYLYAKKEIFK